MKKTIFFALIMVTVLFSCNQKNNEKMTKPSEKLENDGIVMENDSTKVDNQTKMYACSMHPEVQGKLNDTCSKCGMKLSEPIEK